MGNALTASLCLLALAQPRVVWPRQVAPDVAAAPRAAVAAHAAPLPSTEAPSADTVTATAVREWELGNFTRVRALLEPIVANLRALDPITQERALSYLADATINDETLEPLVRRERARGYLGRLLDARPDVSIPAGMFSSALTELFQELQAERASQSAAQCEADQHACLADLSELRSEHEGLKRKYKALQKAYSEQEVEVRDRVARSRVIAMIPLGVGHFYSRRPAVGATFAVAETVFAAAGLGLLLHRTWADSCQRRHGFARESLECESSDADAIYRRRKAEEVMGWSLIGTVALDVLLAQLLLKKVETVSVRRVKRSDLDAASSERAPGGPRERTTPRVRMRPTSRVLPGGSTLGVNVDF